MALHHFITKHSPSIPDVPVEDTTVVVFVRPDYDCDGYSEGYHRVPVRTRDWADVDRVGETTIIARAMVEDVAGYSDDPSASHIISEGEFLGKNWESMTPWQRDYWFERGYVSSHRRGRNV